ncbi:hypothetical protein N7492_003892 [Penicillium capsulatum]|uniref:Alcohol dehydrogenase iron-type/glycerol dehydrogenase GldA domain-containing protein n=1 Tax=Penicillium capsulatum TaxID=69766 RepID=A0A9W9LXW0_9EURO|nr:hypothetical protein N7492_003892 [Penicillium capsulatum]KAJ6121528.1 hypothetical protein N7512_003993 [Penicillium capsulatum]
MPETVRPAFSHRDRPRMSYGLAFPDAAARHVADTFGASRVYVICSGSLARNTDALSRLTTALGPRLAGQRIGMTPHTLWSEVLEIVADARKARADLLLTLGAGTLTDAAKIVAFALANDVNTAKELVTIAQSGEKRPESDIRPPIVPIISVPTSLSAGEYTDYAGGTEDASHRKYMFNPPLRGPELVILDPELVETTPDSIWLSTGVRAVDHCIETICATEATTAESDELAWKALGCLVPGLLGCKKSRVDRDAHLQCLFGSADAIGSALLISLGLGASHGIGHQLGPLGVGHGETSCILLPAVCKFNAAHNANRDQQARVREFLIKDPAVSDVLQERAVDSATADLGDILDAIFRQLGMPRSLADVGVGRDQLDRLAENSLHDRMCRLNPFPLREKAEVLEILEMVV